MLNSNEVLNNLVYTIKEKPLLLKICPFRSNNGTKFFKIVYFTPKYVWTFENPEFWFVDILQAFSCLSYLYPASWTLQPLKVYQQKTKVKIRIKILWCDHLVTYLQIILDTKS